VITIAEVCQLIFQVKCVRIALWAGQYPFESNILDFLTTAGAAWLPGRALSTR
jgi:hypothetical protein